MKGKSYDHQVGIGRISYIWLESFESENLLMIVSIVVQFTNRNLSIVPCWTCFRIHGYKRESEKSYFLFMEDITISWIVHLRSGLLMWREATLLKGSGTRSRIKHFGIKLTLLPQAGFTVANSFSFWFLVLSYDWNYVIYLAVKRK